MKSNTKREVKKLRPEKQIRTEINQQELKQGLRLSVDWRFSIVFSVVIYLLSKYWLQQTNMIDNKQDLFSKNDDF